MQTWSLGVAKLQTRIAALADRPQTTDPLAALADRPGYSDF